MNRRPEKPSESSFYLDLLILIYQDITSQLGWFGPPCEHDINTLRSRFASEGVAFLTKQLPSLGKCLDKALSSDSPLSSEHSFALSSKSGLPLFLGRCFREIFLEDGTIRPLDAMNQNRAVDSVRTIRQICFLLYKLELPYDPQDVAAVLDKFVETDASLSETPTLERVKCTKSRSAVIIAARLIKRVVGGIAPLAIVPSHGPGAVATGERVWEKSNFRRIYASVEGHYPYADWFFYNYTHLCDELESLEVLEEVLTPRAKVALVPKDSRGPRIISLEPLEIQWLQQGMGKEFVRVIEQTSNPARGFVNFTDQLVNRNIAQGQSFDGDYVTVDMKDASDRVSVRLVEALFPDELRAYLFAMRSSSTLLPDGRTVVLKKFAPMGSAICFPIEALTFWALAVGAITVQGWQGKNIPAVFVYGDDLIFEGKYYPFVKHVFEECELVFNEHKCCTGRFFRESCGMDAFLLQNVTPIRVKARFSDRLCPSDLLSYVKYANAFRERGWINSSDFIEERVQTQCAVPYSEFSVRMPSLAFGRFGAVSAQKLNFELFQHRYNKKLMRFEIKAPVVVPKTIRTGNNGWKEMLQRKRPFLSKTDLVCEHLEVGEYAIPRELIVRRSWVDVNR